MAINNESVRNTYKTNPNNCKEKRLEWLEIVSDVERVFHDATHAIIIDEKGFWFARGIPDETNRIDPIYYIRINQQKIKKRDLFVLLGKKLFSLSSENSELKALVQEIKNVNREINMMMPEYGRLRNMEVNDVASDLPFFSRMSEFVAGIFGFTNHY